uniref:Uncharacterized protein n=1 Tax=Rhabditophanes sp. KR3021 TaxID=114890 RepID=A0AC35UD34_9BILA
MAMTSVVAFYPGDDQNMQTEAVSIRSQRAKELMPPSYMKRSQFLVYDYFNPRDQQPNYVNQVNKNEERFNYLRRHFSLFPVAEKSFPRTVQYTEPIKSLSGLLVANHNSRDE